ncbi:uncharacterized protein LOC131598196 [Vicia villosa]|uniref:uncharacterized protein LOC131598196 n=1 Tax=Vicia villosa TaxID=3911 RepID=UPI00273C96BE|nr:uncharacterized protein LOC131598196 [Vicia villosa]
MEETKRIESNCSPLIAELWGVHEVLRLVVEKGFKNVILESDSKEAIDISNKASRNKLVSGNLVCKIHDWMRMCEKVEINHVYREVNGCANRLAKHGKELGVGYVFLLNMPRWLVDNFSRDSKGVLYSRIGCG